MKFQKQITNKLFFGKYPYKITCEIGGAYLIRSCGTTEILLENSSIVNHCLRPNGFYRPNPINLAKLRAFVNEAKNFINDLDIKTRIERNSIDFYILSNEVYKFAQSILDKFITKVSEPSDINELEKLLENSKYNLCNNLPHGKYKYKIIFKENIPLTTRQNLIEWTEKYSKDDIHIKKSTQIHFKGIKYRYGVHYFYVKDHRMITMIYLIANGYIRKTEEFVIRSLEETA